VVDVVQGYIRFLKDEARRATKTAAHNRLQGIRAGREKLAVAQTERELVPLVEAMTLVDEVAGAVVARVKSRSCERSTIRITTQSPSSAAARWERLVAWPGLTLRQFRRARRPLCRSARFRRPGGSVDRHQWQVWRVVGAGRRRCAGMGGRGDVVRIVLLRPVHRLDPAVMAVAASRRHTPSLRSASRNSSRPPSED